MKKIVSLMLALLFCISLFSGCTAPEENDGQTRIVTDTWGREVEIPETVETIVCLGSGAPRIAAYLGVVDKMVGAEDHDLKGVTVLRDYNVVYQEQLANLPAVGAGGGSGANNGYAEQIIMAQPDVILAGFSQEAAEELQQQTGIPHLTGAFFYIDGEVLHLLGTAVKAHAGAFQLMEILAIDGICLGFRH